MALVKTSDFRTRAFSIVLLVLAATCGSAPAQYWGDRSGGWGWDNRPAGGWGWDRPSGGWDYRFPGWGGGERSRSDRYYRRSPYRDPFSGERHKSPAPAVVDYSKAPPPRKLDTPPS